MDVGVIVLSLVVGSFGVASAVVGFIADAKRLTWYDIDIDVYEGVCRYPPNAAFVLALVAVPLLLVAQIIASLAGGCCGCCRPQHGASESKRVVGIIAAVLSWIATFLAGGFYLNGAVWNAPVTRDIDTWCRLLRAGYFRLPALLSLAATVIAILSYIMLRARAPESRPSTAPVPAAGTSHPKPDVPQEPPVGEAVEVPQTQWSAHGHDQRQEQFPEVPRHPVGGYGRASNPQRTHPPQRQAQPAFEVMMA